MTIINSNIVSGIATTTLPSKFNAKANKPLHAHAMKGFGDILKTISGLRKASKNEAMPDVIAQVLAAAEPGRKATAEIALNSVRVSPVTKSSADPMIALEGNLMGKLVNEMLPKGKDSVYGKGLAGETWRGFAVDQMAGAMVQSDPLGLGIKPFASTNAVDEKIHYEASDPNANSAFNITPFAFKA